MIHERQRRITLPRAGVRLGRDTTEELRAMHIDQFCNVDAPSLPQEVSIEFVRAQAPDESPDLSYLEQSYNDVENDGERESMQKADEARLAAYNCGDWYMRGLFVEARVQVPIGGGSFTLFTLRSAGVWGVESDNGEEYEKELWQEEENALRAARFSG